MRSFRYLSLLCAGCLGLALLLTAQSPRPGNADTVARPKKGSTDPGAANPGTQPKEADLPKIPSVYKRNPDAPNGAEPTFRVESTSVSVDVAVVDNQGVFIPNIPIEAFRITEDNVPQKIGGMTMGEAPMTVALVVEFSNLFQQYGSEPWYQTLTAASEFLNTLKPNDYVAIVAYDLKPEILSDFSIDRRDAADAMARMRMAGFSESALYDAITFTADRMQEIEGRKAIVLLASGMDTISQQNFGQARKKIQSSGVPIYAVGLMQAIRDYYFARGALSDSSMASFAVADSQMRTFAKESGGVAFFPRFYGEFPRIFQSVAQALRAQYVLTYTPTNSARDGKFRKLKVELIDPATNKPMVIKDPKGKNVKYEIVTKPGYVAPREVE
jgi:VWFA-related protein